MTFATRARTAQQHRKGGTCTVSTLLDGLDADYREEVQAAMQDFSIYASVIAAILTEDGHEVTAETLNRHRRGRCLCR